MSLINRNNLDENDELTEGDQTTEADIVALLSKLSIIYLARF